LKKILVYNGIHWELNNVAMQLTACRFGNIWNQFRLTVVNQGYCMPDDRTHYGKASHAQQRGRNRLIGAKNLNGFAPVLALANPDLRLRHP
jgi:hypothetical protein